MTVKEAEGTRLKLDDVDLDALQARQANHVDLVVEVSDVPHFVFPRFQQLAGRDPTFAGFSKSGADGPVGGFSHEKLGFCSMCGHAALWGSEV